MEEDIARLRRLNPAIVVARPSTQMPGREPHWLFIFETGGLSSRCSKMGALRRLGGKSKDLAILASPSLPGPVLPARVHRFRTNPSRSTMAFSHSRPSPIRINRSFRVGRPQGSVSRLQLQPLHGPVLLRRRTGLRPLGIRAPDSGREIAPAESRRRGPGSRNKGSVFPPQAPVGCPELQTRQPRV